jgi:hypothetical protein
LRRTCHGPPVHRASKGKWRRDYLPPEGGLRQGRNGRSEPGFAVLCGKSARILSQESSPSN